MQLYCFCEIYVEKLCFVKGKKVVWDWTWGGYMQKKKASGALPNNFYKKKACLFQLNSRNDMLPVFIVKTQKENHVTS